MLVLFRHDEKAQIIIHTANMIPFDWENMTQAVWQSPLLPLATANSLSTAEPGPIGSGSKFKTDFLNYLRAYDSKRTNDPTRNGICIPLIEQLSKYDFHEIRGALVGSAPGRTDVNIDTNSQTLWGWAGLRNVLKSVPAPGPEPDIVVQISSIATLGVNDSWLNKTLFEVLRASKTSKATKAKFHIIFPTADEIRRSLNGYASGCAIHTRIQSPPQVKQLQYLQPMLCHWAGDGPQHKTIHTKIYDAGRKRAAPHIKTYVRFSDKTQSSIDWMLVTSANLSKQAWGEATKPDGTSRICSYELGVLVWPELFGEKAAMVPTFKSDTPSITAEQPDDLVVGARMPYDLPLVPYAEEDEPWCASKSYEEFDWKGMDYKLA